MTIACAGIGVGAVAGVAIGDAYLLCRGAVCVTPSWVKTDNIELEVGRFEEAIRIAGAQLHSVREQIPRDTPSDIAEFIDTHLLMLEDKALSSQPINLIRNEGLSAEWALQQHRDALIQVFEKMEDTYLRTRRDDLDHVVNRILNILLEQHDSPFDELREQIILAEDLTPADVILMKNQGIAGFVTDYGGPMSHTAILARSLGIPAVVGTRGATHCLKHGERLVLDAGNGIVLANCDDTMLSHFEARRAADFSRAAELRRRGAEPPVTRDGQAIHLLANIELPRGRQYGTCERGSGHRAVSHRIPVYEPAHATQRGRALCCLQFSGRRHAGQTDNHTHPRPRGRQAAGWGRSHSRLEQSGPGAACHPTLP